MRALWLLFLAAIAACSDAPVLADALPVSQQAHADVPRGRPLPRARDASHEAYMGIGLGLSIDASAAPPVDAFDPRSLSGLQAYYHADDGFGSANTPSGGQTGYVPKLPDNSSNVRTVNSGNNANAPVYDAATLGGSIQVTALKGAYLQVLTAQASQWTFAHDGTGVTLWAVVKPTGTGARCTIFNTSGTEFSQGIHLLYDGTPTTGERFKFRVRKGSGTLVVDLAGAALSSPINGTYVVVATYSESASPKACLYVNGVLVASGASTNLPPSSAAPASGGLAIGRIQGAGLYYLDGYFRSGGAYSRVLSSSEIASLSSNALALASPRTIRRIWTVGDSITAQTLYQQQVQERALASTLKLHRIDWLGTSVSGEIPLWVDRQHNGHVGATIATIKADVDAVGSLGATPDDIFLLAGTNNAAADMTAAQPDYATLVDTLRAKFPSARVLCLRPPRYLADANKKVGMEAFAAWIRDTFVPARQALGQNVAYRDADVSADADISADNIHPTTAGYGVIGNKLADQDGY